MDRAYSKMGDVLSIKAVYGKSLWLWGKKRLKGMITMMDVSKSTFITFFLQSKIPVSFSFLPLFLLFFSSAAQSKDDKDPALQRLVQSSVIVKPEWKQLKEDLKKRKHSLTPKILERRLKRLHSLLGDKKSQNRALASIDNLEKKLQKYPYHLAKLYKDRANILNEQEHYKKALDSYFKALNVNALPHRDHLEVLYRLANIYLASEKKQDLAKAFELVDQMIVLSGDRIDPVVCALKAETSRMKNKQLWALQWMERAIQAKNSNKPREAWLAFVAGRHLELGNFQKALPSLFLLTSFYPEKKQYWKLLSQTYAQVKNEKKALSTSALAHKQELLHREQDLTLLAHAYSQGGVPYKAAHVLHNNLEQNKVKGSQKNYMLLGQFWSMAREEDKALQAYEKAGRMATERQKNQKTGKSRALSSLKQKDMQLFRNLGQIYQNKGQWGKALSYYLKAMRSHPGDIPADLYLAIGNMYLNVKQYAKSINFFEQIVTIKDAPIEKVKLARKWINHVHQVRNAEQGKDAGQADQAHVIATL